MSDTDSFIDEVSEEVRRDRLYLALRRYGWIGILAVLLIVGGAAWREYSAAQHRAAAESLGDSILAALEMDDRGARIDALAGVEVENAGGKALLALLTAAEQGANDRPEDAAATLSAIATDGDVPQIYRDMAAFKLLLRQADSAAPEERLTGFEALARAGSPLRLLAEEQMALVEIETGETDAALARLRGILEDAEVTPGLRQRVTQVIVALGGDTEAA